MNISLNCIYVPLVRTHEYWLLYLAKGGFGGSHLKSQHLGDRGRRIPDWKLVWATKYGLVSKE